MTGFPTQQDGVLYLTEGGQETEIMYRHGHHLPEFAMYPLLDDPAAMADLTAMYTRVLEAAASNNWNAMSSGLPTIAAARTGGQAGLYPRGDAYALNHTMTADEAEGYHTFQLQVMKDCGVDFVWAAMFNAIPEAVGVARATAKVGVPLSLMAREVKAARG